MDPLEVTLVVEVTLVGLLGPAGPVVERFADTRPRERLALRIRRDRNPGSSE